MAKSYISTDNGDIALFSIVARKYSDAVTALGKAMGNAAKDAATSKDMTAYERLRNRVDDLSKQLKEIESRLPKIKFDFIKGEYFLGEKDGKEVYRFRVIKKDIGFVDVPAKSAYDAERIAERMAKNGEVSFSVAPYEFQNIANAI